MAQPKEGAYDCIIVGGGPSGLSCALLLARFRRRVLVIDSGKPRNAPSNAMHGYLTRDNVHPQVYLEKARRDVLRYPCVSLKRCTVTEVESEKVEIEQAANPDKTDTAGECVCGVKIRCEDGTSERARYLVYATGVHDFIPKLPGIHELYGKSVHHCPFCDAYEHRDTRIAVYGTGTKGSGLALEMLPISKDVILCTDGDPLENIPAHHRDKMDEFGIKVLDYKEVYTERIARLEGEGCDLKQIVFYERTEEMSPQNEREMTFPPPEPTCEQGQSPSGPERKLEDDDAEKGTFAVERDTLFFNTGREQQSGLIDKMGIGKSEKRDMQVSNVMGATPHGRVFVTGNAAQGPLKLVIEAAAQGALTAVEVNKELTKEDLGLEFL